MDVLWVVLIVVSAAILLYGFLILGVLLGNALVPPPYGANFMLKLAPWLCDDEEREAGRLWDANERARKQNELEDLRRGQC